MVRTGKHVVAESEAPLVMFNPRIQMMQLLSIGLSGADNHAWHCKTLENGLSFYGIHDSFYM